MSSNSLETLRKTYAGPMSAAEIQLLRDVQSFIDFAIRNGLSFGMVMGTLAHDINNLRRYGDDLRAALEDGVQPKVTSYANLGPEDVGEPDETDRPKRRKRTGKTS